MSRDYAAQADPARNPNFIRRWSEKPSHDRGMMPVGEVANRVVNNMAIRAVAHWLQQADQLDGEDRAVCLKTADAIMQTAGLRWVDFVPRIAA